MSSKPYEKSRRSSKYSRKQDLYEEIERANDKRMEGYRESSRNEMKRRQVNNNASPSPSDSTESEANERVKRSSRKLKNDTIQEISKIKTKMEKLKIKHEFYNDKLLNLSHNAGRRYANDPSSNEGSSIAHSYSGESFGTYYDDDASIPKKSGNREEIKPKNVSRNAGYPVLEKRSLHPWEYTIDEYYGSDSDDSSNVDAESSSRFDSQGDDLEPEYISGSSQTTLD